MFEHIQADDRFHLVLKGAEVGLRFEIADMNLDIREMGQLPPETREMLLVDVRSHIPLPLRGEFAASG